MKKDVDSEGTIRYYNEQGQLHREGGPAVIEYDGSKYWFVNNKLHREGGPAIEHDSGAKSWVLNNKWHRIDGPAVEYSNGDKEYWIEGEQLSEEEFWKHPKVMLYWIVNFLDASKE